MMAQSSGSNDPQSPQPSRFERAIPFRESRGPLGPFKATKIMADLIEHLRAKVELKRRRHKIKFIESCFTGTDAVDVVLHFLLSDTDTFSTDLSREKAVKVCQVLINRKVFQSATDKPGSEKATTFEDSSSKLYHFIGEYVVLAPQTIDGEEEEEEEETESGSSTETSSSEASSKPPSLERLRLSDHFFEAEDEPSMPSLSPIPHPSHMSHIGLLSSLISSSKSRSRENSQERNQRKTLTSTEVEETWKEVALTQLLTLVDLTFLDGILSEDKRSRQQEERQHIIISNIVAKNWNLPLLPSSLEQPSDPLLQTAMDCIECLPNGLSLLSEPVFKRQGAEAKLWAKDIVVKHYSGLGCCLLPERFVELHLAILNLILDNHRENALAALQLYMILLPVAVREELYRLIKFMISLAADTSLRLDIQKTNEMAVLGLLSSSIFHHKLLGPNLVQKLVQFLMSEVDTVFTVPREVRMKVAARLHEIKTGKPLLSYESSFCNRVSMEEYKRQSKDCTEESLVDLMNSVLDDTRISLKEKKQKLKLFQKSYPSLYVGHFDGLL